MWKKSTGFEANQKRNLFTKMKKIDERKSHVPCAALDFILFFYDIFLSIQLEIPDFIYDENAHIDVSRFGVGARPIKTECVCVRCVFSVISLG